MAPRVVVQVCEMREQLSARPPGLRSRSAPAAERPAAPPEPPLPLNSPAAHRTPAPLLHLRGLGWGPGACSSPASRHPRHAWCLAYLMAGG